MGSVGSGVAGEQEFAMKSVGTRTTLPRAPPLSRRCPADRSCSAERLPPPPATASEGTASSEERGSIRVVSLDVCSNLVGLGGKDIDTGGTKTDNHNNPPNHNPPKILPVSGKLEQNNSGLVRPSAFKPVVPKSFHSMQNLVGQTSSGEGRGGAGGGEPGAVPEALLLDQDSPGRGSFRAEGAGGGMSDSGRNSLTSLPTYTGSGSGYVPPAALGTLSASTSHINRLGTTAGAAVAQDKLEKPGYQNGLSASDSGHSSSGKSSSSYQRLCHLGDTPAPLRPSPSSDDVIQDLEDRLWEKEQEVQHMHRNLDQSEAAIVQVFEEKQRVWERQMEELRQNYASRLQQVTRRAQRSQNALQAQITRLSQDKRRLQEEMPALLAQREELERKCLDFRKEQADILPRLEETNHVAPQTVQELADALVQVWEEIPQETIRHLIRSMPRLCREVIQAPLLYRDEMMTWNQIKQTEPTSKSSETALTHTKTSFSLSGVYPEGEAGLRFWVLNELLGSWAERLLPPWGAPYCLRTPTEPSSTPLTHTSDALLSFQSDEAKAQRQETQRQERQQRNLREQLEQLQGALRLERQQRELQAHSFDQERHTWIDEKERVLKYQAQLQVSYVETLQKNQALEQQVGQLGTKLTPSPSSSISPPPPPALSTLPPLPSDQKGPPSLLQLPPPWAGPSRLERIESTEI
ncbi:unnamed protein product [Oncorhynchus mykiss]|uniref:Leucine zipper tumor suppressor 3 n=1 Tax=Oncorhynchus mykiss TaxID=8022 RepID=A0A060W9Y9_ONCMY|nr:unnamed protein product [Oncorhynchus mykiss]